jgi:hypothetical protein
MRDVFETGNVEEETRKERKGRQGKGGKTIFFDGG